MTALGFGLSPVFMRGSGFSFLDIADLVAHWDSSAGLTKDGGGSPGDGDRITSWVDRVASYDMLQATEAKMPTLDVAAGVQSVEFDGVDDLLRCNAAALLSALNTAVGTLVVVYEYDTLADFKTVCSASDEATSNNQLVLYGYRNAAQPNIAWYHSDAGSADNLHGSTTVVVNTKTLGILASSGTAYSVRVNGTDDTETVVGGSNSGDWYADISAGFDSLVLGADNKNATASSFFPGKIYDVALYSRELTAVEIALIEDNYP